MRKNPGMIINIYIFFLHVKSCDFDRFGGAESEKKWVQKKLKRGFKRVKIG